MNEAQRSVLQKHHVELAHDIVVTERILGICFQDNLFDKHLIDIIRAEPTPGRQAYKLLDLLPRRGPDAFDKFVHILQPDYPWLASKLMASLERETGKSNGEFVRPGTLPNINLQVAGQSPRKVPSPRSSTVLNHNHEDHVDSAEEDIKETVSGFMQRQHSLNMKLCHAEKKAVEKFLTHQVKTQRQRGQSAQSVDDEPDNKTTTYQTDFVKEWLLLTFTKVKSQYEAIVKKPNKKKNRQYNAGYNDSSESDDDDKKYTQNSINFEVIESQIDRVMKKVQKTENELTKCHHMVDDPDKKLPLNRHVDRIIKEKQKVKEDLELEKRETDKVSQKMKCLNMEKEKLEHEIKLKDVQLDIMKTEVNSLKRDNMGLSKEVERLQKAQLQHAEKENTLMNLREMITELKTSREDVEMENADLKTQLERIDNKKPDTSRTSSSSSSKNTTLTKTYSKGQGSRIVARKKTYVT